MHKHIEEANHIYIKNFITPERSYELAKSFLEFAKTNNLTGDGQVIDSQSTYNHIDFLELLCEKTPEVSQFLGETVLPTYTYARVYKKGAILDRHKDREACEISLTLNLSKDKDWPIWIQKPNGEEVSLNLKSGDAMMYLGCQADHWRNEFEGDEYIQVFLHYVRSRGPNAWAVFDKEKNAPLDYDNDVKDTIKFYIPSDEHLKVFSEFICVFDNIVPDDLCDDIIKEYNNADDWNPANVGGGTVVKSIRDVDEIPISFPHVIQKNSSVRAELDQKLYQVASSVLGLYNSKFPGACIQEDSGYQLLRYKTGQFYRQHTDHFKSHPRTISCSLALNDDYEGGEFAFFDKKLKIPLKKGSVIMFPSNFMFPHEILKVTKGTRYSIITWFV